MKSTNNRGQPDEAAEAKGSVAEYFFEGGIKEVRRRLCQCIANVLEEKHKTAKAVTGECCLAEDELPTLEACLAEPDLLRHEVFSRVAIYLDLPPIENLLELDFSTEKNRTRAIEIAKGRNARLAAASGRGPKKVTMEQLAPVYIASKILSEM